MSNIGGLRCPACGSELEVSISYNGCDWDSEAGEGSGFNYTIYLSCTHCARTYPIGHIKRENDFSTKTVCTRLSRLVGE